MRRALAVLLLVRVTVAEPPPEPTPPIDPGVQLQLSVAGKRREFQIGEIIPIKLSFSSRIRDRYEVDQAQYDRSGRMNSERFDVAPVDGVDDPLAQYFAEGVHFGGGLRGVEFLAAKPWTIQLNLNEWVRFTKPGEYKLKVSSDRVSVVDRRSPFGTSTVTATSNEVTLKILPSDPEWEKRTHDKAVATLKSKTVAKLRHGDDSPARRAINTLRFLGTPEATRELVKQMRGERDGFDATCFFGVIASPHRIVAREALEAALRDPNQAVGDNLLDALVFITRSDEAATNDEKRTEKEREVLGKLVEALPNKRGEAARVSLYTSLERDWVRVDAQLLSPETTQKLVPQLLAMFDDLAAEQKEMLLDWRWMEIKSPALLPLLKRYAEQDSSDPKEDLHYNARSLAALALGRWFELDPAGARPVIISEMSRAKPRFGARELGMLPEKTLPGVDRLLVNHFQGNEDFGTAANLATLIARYGSRDILAQVLQKLDSNIGKWACALQNPLLAYVLRVDPELARPRLEKAIVTCGKENGCNGSFFSEIAAIHYDPLLEELAIRALENSDDRFASGAAEMLRKFGSSAAEAALWKRYEKWSERSAGREAQINLEAVSARIRQEGETENLSLGRSLVQAVAKGNRWLTDESKLRQLMTMSKVPTIQYELESYLAKWGPSLRVSVLSCTDRSPGLFATVAHYEFESLDALKEKLRQFPPGTTFQLFQSLGAENQSCIDDLRAFLTNHQFTATEGESGG